MDSWFVFWPFFFVFGAIVGSFLNVVVFRYNSGLSFLKGRSKCFSCGHELAWRDLIPILSFVFQRGRCQYCGSAISWQYPIVEFLAGILATLIFLKFGLAPDLFFFLIVFSLILAISVYDFRHKIIPDGLVYSLVTLSILRFLWGYFYSGGFDISVLWSALGGFLFFVFIWFVSWGRWMGLGDAKLSLGMGFLLNACQNLSVISLSFVLGSVIILFYILVVKFYIFWTNQNIKIEREIPFAPFLALAFFTVLLLNFDYCYFLYF